MKNDYIHHENGTTSIYIKCLDFLLEMRISTVDFLLEMRISTVDFHILERRGYSICAKWSQDSRTFYVMSRGKYIHRLLKGEPKGMHVHHKDGNGLNNTRENLEVLTPSEHRRKRRTKEPIIGDPKKGVKAHILSKAELNKKKCDRRYWFRLDVNGVYYGTFDNTTELSLSTNISDMVVNRKWTDEQIYAKILPLGHDKEYVAVINKKVRRFFRTPDSSKVKEKPSKRKERFKK
ncbi:HNH endonuclease signature motif containing protein [Bacillus cereus]|nr:HNH endonuclease signature motif containing protein [Bacillus cereus]